MPISKRFIFIILIFSLSAATLLTACGASKDSGKNSGVPTGALAKIDSANVEVGLGSPTPITVTVDVSFEKACTQISSIEQTMLRDGNAMKIRITVRTADLGETCADFPQSFRLLLPINASGLQKGVYIVEVNDVNAGRFESNN